MSRRNEAGRDISKYEGTIHLNPPQGEEKFIVGKTLYQDLTPDLFAKSQVKLTQRPHKKLPMPEDLIDLPKFRRNNPYDYRNQKDYVENEKTLKMRRRWKISNEEESRSFTGSWQSSKPNQVMLCIDKGVCVARFLDDWYEFKPIPNIHREDIGISHLEKIIEREDNSERKKKAAMKEEYSSSDSDVKKEGGVVNFKKIIEKFSQSTPSSMKEEEQYSEEEEDKGLDYTQYFGEDDVDEVEQEKSPETSDDDDERKVSSENDSDEDADEEGNGEGGDIKSESQQAQLAQESGDDSADEKTASSASKKSTQSKKMKSESIGSPMSLSTQDRKRKSEAESASSQSTKEGFVTSREVKDYMMQFGGIVESIRLLAFFKPRLNTNESVEWFKRVVDEQCEIDNDKYVLRAGKSVTKKGRR